ncbi:MAG: hypothetical protein KDK48_02035 [Chlamydiia bacterium]|nr:hypothetical protein [Chlamydiia bacterium]
MIEGTRILEGMFPQFVTWAEVYSSQEEPPPSPAPSRGSGRIPHFFVSDLDADQVVVELKCLAAQVHTIALRVLMKAVPELSATQDIAVGYTGSDARGEKLSKLSPIELVVFTRDKEHPLIGRIHETARNYPRLFFRELEIKAPEDNLLQFTNTDPNFPQNVPFPSRVLDARFLGGCNALWQETKGAFLNQVSTGTATINKWKSSALGRAVKALKETKEGSTAHGVNLQAGLLTFDDDKIKGVKYPLLRTLQYKVDLLCLRALKEGKGEGVLPLSIAERIDWLAKSKIHTHGGMDWAKLKKAYVTLLLMYGASQEQYAHKKADTISVDTESLNEMADLVQKFAASEFKFLKK